MNEKDLLWLSGWLEGEGSFMKGPPSKPGLPIISGCGKDYDIINKVASLLGVTAIRTNKRKNNWSVIWTVKIKGHKAVLLMKKLLPYMGTRRRKQINKALASYKASFHKISKSEQKIIQQENIKRDLTQSEIAQNHGIRRETVNRICNKSLQSPHY